MNRTSLKYLIQSRVKCTQQAHAPVQLHAIGAPTGFAPEWRSPCHWNLKFYSLLDFSPLTITTEKLSGLAFSVYDGWKKQENKKPLPDKAVRYVVQFGKNPGNKFF